MPEIEWTSHAVERFVERHAPEMGYGAARALLERHAWRIAWLKRRTNRGDALARLDLDDPPLTLTLVVKPERGVDVVATVLPAETGHDTSEATARAALEPGEQPLPPIIPTPGFRPPIDLTTGEKLLMELALRQQEYFVAADRAASIQAACYRREVERIGAHLRCLREWIEARRRRKSERRTGQ